MANDNITRKLRTLREAARYDCGSYIQELIDGLAHALRDEPGSDTGWLLLRAIEKDVEQGVVLESAIEWNLDTYMKIGLAFASLMEYFENKDFEIANDAAILVMQMVKKYIDDDKVFVKPIC